MAERVMLVCDVCGKPAVETVGIRAGGRSLQKDVCETHLAELTNGSRQARRGRPRGSASRSPAKSTAKRTARRSAKRTAKRTSKRTTRKAAGRRGRSARAGSSGPSS